MTKNRPALSSGEDDANTARFAGHHGLEHQHTGRKLAYQWDFYPFGVGSWRRARNIVRGTLHGRSTTAFEYHYVLLSDSVEASGFERDSIRRYLVCVIDLDHPVPALAAVSKDWLEWHVDELPDPAIAVEHERWSRFFTLLGQNAEFGHAVVDRDNASRCVEAAVHAEWRFQHDELLVWVLDGRVHQQLFALLDIATPLIEAAERYVDESS